MMALLKGHKIHLRISQGFSGTIVLDGAARHEFPTGEIVVCGIIPGDDCTENIEVVVDPPAVGPSRDRCVEYEVQFLA